ncbi:MAG: hypothetical protein EON96_01540 [Caulobacteraceae bacterium]|nr:MAG: hypothetical protein EON96_01540 [Caulobacteraceae bacterium]
MKVFVLLGLAAAVSAAGCNTVPAYITQPLQTPDGRLGFSVQGIASYTRDEVKVTDEVRKVLEGSCGGPVEITSIDFRDATNAAGVPHLAYQASAACTG